MLQFSTKLLICLLLFFNCHIFSQEKLDRENIVPFNIEKDILLGQFDCKTDVDDLHAAVAFYMLLSHPDFKSIKYHAVAGTYGIQEGLYVNPNKLFHNLFGKNWSDANNNFDYALKKVSQKISPILNAGGTVWIAEAGQSDFSAALIKKIKSEHPSINAKEQFKIVQHSTWNEDVTSKENLAYVKKHVSYYKIPDGNAVGNGTPGFRDEHYTQYSFPILNKELMNHWLVAKTIANEFNGVDGRYLNKAIKAGGLDFSDLAETCWILGIEHIKDVTEFFNTYKQ